MHVYDQVSSGQLGDWTGMSVYNSKGMPPYSVKEVPLIVMP